MSSSPHSSTVTTPAYIFEPTSNIQNIDLVTLPATWSAPSSCLDTTQVYLVSATDTNGKVWYEYAFAFASLPSLALAVEPSSSCLPPSYDDKVPYITDGDCPSGYTEAERYQQATYRNQLADLVTCCPRVNDPTWNFKNQTQTSRRIYGCLLSLSEGSPLTGNIIDGNRKVPLTTTMNSAEHIIGWGVTMLSTSPTSSTPPTVTNTDDHDTKGGLTTGAAAGIGVGVALGVIGIFGVVFFLYRSRRRDRSSRADYQDQPLSDGGPVTEERQVYSQTSHSTPPSEMPAGSLSTRA